ncbi:MAG: FAD-dependent oxidoreductase [Pseudomonadota bacterium]
MKSRARVVVIGGGVVGVSTLYHLARKGWGDDVILLEKAELTSGSTWHAAGLLPLFGLNYTMGRIQQYSLGCYQKLEEETGQPVGYKNVGSLRLAMNQDRMDEYHHYVSVAETMGVNVNWMTPEEISDTWPLIKPDGLLGGIHHPDDGYIQPADLTLALAKGARNRGATIYRKTAVIGIEPIHTGEWVVHTTQGDIACEHVVSASGCYARQTGKMVGLDVPVIPVEHQYIVTEAHPELVAKRAAGLDEMPVIRETDSSWYLREEQGGFILGPYENNAPSCYVNGPHPESEYELFQEDLERLVPHIETAMVRVPAFGEVGIKQTYNGAIAYAPDANPLVGPAWGLDNFWLNEAHIFGITLAGGAGWQLAEWIVDGEPTIDMLPVDPRRFGGYATQQYAMQKNEEAYAHMFTIHYPDEERPAARPLRTAPCYERMKEKGAVFGQISGWERPNWFVTDGSPPEDHWSFRRSKWFDAVGEEVRNVTRNVGLLDMTTFAKCRIEGSGAEAFLDYLVANRLPSQIGRLALGHALNTNGGIHSEFTIHRESDESFYLVSAARLQRFDHDYIKKHMPRDGSVQFTDLTGTTGVFVVAGPRARALLERVSEDAFSNEAFPWLRAREVSIGMVPVNAMRVNYIGELGWELHHPLEYQNQLFDTLFEAGKDLGLKPFGIRAMDSMRLEKSYRMPGTELSIEYSAHESVMDRFVHPDKNFLGREGLLEWNKRKEQNRLVTLEIQGARDADAIGMNPITLDGKLVGRSTSGGYGFRVGQSLALAMVNSDLAREGQVFRMRILDQVCDAVVVKDSPFDPNNERLRNVNGANH